MQTRTVGRELALLLLTQVTDNELQNLSTLSVENLLNQALDTLMKHWRDELDECASFLEIAHQALIDSELEDKGINSLHTVRGHLQVCLKKSEFILNSLSDSIELPRLLALGEQKEIRLMAISRVVKVIQIQSEIDMTLDSVMEGWRLKRLPKIDQDILRLAFVDLNHFGVPIAVACNEAVNLANRYSDEKGRKMINGVLRRLQNSFVPSKTR